jgi:caffeoyl-CoA O-methyltransferase
MTSQIAFLDPAVDRYLTAHTTPPADIERRLIDQTQALPQAGMQIGAPQARFMTMLTRTLQPRLAIEIGTFTGYSTLAVAKSLPPGGRLIACDVSDEWTSIGRAYWTEAGVDDRIELRIGPAADTLDSLPIEPRVDLAFIDADKTGYIGYFEQLVPRLSERGVILVDNVLWDGQVTDETDQSENTRALREFNAHVVADPRVEVALLPIGDGLSMITLR